MKITEELYEHAVDTTAAISAANPILASVETFAAGMSNETSMNARLLGSTLMFIGLGSAYSRGRDMSKRIFGVGEESTEFAKSLHDALYSAFFLGVTQPPFYYAIGARNWKEIAVGTVGGMVIQAALGPLSGYSIDAYRDLAGIKESERIPNSVRRMNPSTKKYIAAALTGASVALMAGIYSLNG